MPLAMEMSLVMEGDVPSADGVPSDGGDVRIPREGAGTEVMTKDTAAIPKSVEVPHWVSTLMMMKMIFFLLPPLAYRLSRPAALVTQRALGSVHSPRCRRI